MLCFRGYRMPMFNQEHIYVIFILIADYEANERKGSVNYNDNQRLVSLPWSRFSPPLPDGGDSGLIAHINKGTLASFLDLLFS